MSESYVDHVYHSFIVIVSNTDAATEHSYTNM